MGIKRIIKEYCGQTLRKYDSLDEMDQFFERRNLPKLTQEEIHDLNKPISVEEMIIKNLPKRKNSFNHGVKQWRQTRNPQRLNIL